jgi:mannose-1-phosphate guanylyltransferase
MIERVLFHLAEHGVEHAVMSMGHLPDSFLDAYPDRRIAGVSVSFAIEPSPLGTGGALRFAGIDAGMDETFLAINGDVLTDLDITDLVVRHRASGAEGTIALSPVDDPSAFGVVVTDTDGRVTDFVEKPAPGTAPSHDINAGTYVLEPAFFDRVRPDAAVSIEREVFPQMVADGVLGAVVDTSYWLDAGTPSSYLRANTDVLDGVRVLGHPGELRAGVLRLANCTVSASATVERSVLARDVTVRGAARVEGSVILEGATIGEGASVLDSVVGPRAFVGDGATLARNCLVAEDAAVPQGARLERSVVSS